MRVEKGKRGRRLVHEKNYHITHNDCLLWLANNAINIPNEFISITEFLTFLEAIAHPKEEKSIHINVPFPIDL